MDGPHDETAHPLPLCLSEDPVRGARRGGHLYTSKEAAREVLSLQCHAHRSRDEEQQVAAELKRLREAVELRQVGARRSVSLTLRSSSSIKWHAATRQRDRVQLTSDDAFAP
jgi:hypothetical protein